MDCSTRVHSHDVKDRMYCHITDEDNWRDCDVQSCPHRLTALQTGKANPACFIRCTPTNAPGQPLPAAEAAAATALLQPPAPTTAPEPECDVTHDPIPPDSPPHSPQQTAHPIITDTAEDMATQQTILDAIAALTAAT